MFAPEDWKPKEYNSTYHGIQFYSYYHAVAYTWFEWRASFGAVLSYDYVFPKQRFELKVDNTRMFLIPWIRYERTSNNPEYFFCTEVNKYFSKLWKMFKLQYPQLYKQVQPMSTFEFQYQIFDLWEKESRQPYTSQIEIDNTVNRK